jgi:tetratricopeptide (TPR) repeat protein
MAVKLLLLFVFFSVSKLTAQEKTFEREYTYKASELDSKVSCRAIAVNQLRTILLNELGVYVQSEQILKTSDVSGKFSQDFVENIATISAGVTKLIVLDEKWTGETFWMKASITIDRNILEESLKQLIADRQKLKELEEVKRKLIAATNEIERLKTAEIKNGTNNQATREDNYNKEINALSAGDFFYRGIQKYDDMDYSGAINDFSKAIELEPEPEAFNNRGVVKNELQDYQGAIDDFNKAIGIAPNLAGAYVNWK